MRLEERKVAFSERVELMHPMYFDICPDAIENILRYLSSRSNKPDWTTFISAADVVSLSDVQGGLGESMLSRFNDVYMPKSISKRKITGDWADVARKDIASKLLRFDEKIQLATEPGDKD